MADPRAYPGTPRWVRISAIVAGGVAMLLVGLLHMTGGSRHILPSVGSLDHSATHAADERSR